MKTITTLLLLFPLTTYAFDQWSDADKTRETVYLSLHIIDWGQSLDIAKRPDEYNEDNFILGNKPSVNRVNTHFAIASVMHVVAVHVMPAKWRPAFQYYWIVIEANTVYSNYSIGLRMNF